MNGLPVTLLYRAADAHQAAFLKRVLEERGIPVQEAGGKAAGLLGELGAADALSVELWVSVDRAQEGKRVVEAHLQARPTRSAARSVWACAGCGEQNDGNFELCWKCQEPRPES